MQSTIAFGLVARDEGQREAQLAEILRPAWDLAQEHDAGRWLVTIAWLLGDAAVDERLPQAYNYYATAAAVARQHGDERRYRISLDVIRRNVEELIEHGQAEDAAFVCRYVIEFWEQMELAGWVEDGIAELHRLIQESGDGQEGQRERQNHAFSMEKQAEAPTKRCAPQWGRASNI